MCKKSRGHDARRTRRRAAGLVVLALVTGFAVGSDAQQVDSAEAIMAATTRAARHTRQIAAMHLRGAEVDRDAFRARWTDAAPARGGQGRDAAEAEPVVFRWVGTTAHAWGAWVTPGATVEDWVEQAISLCTDEDVCEINVFEGPEHATHEIPVPEANRAGLKWVLRYRRDETPRVVVEEVRAEPGHERRTWTFDR